MDKMEPIITRNKIDHDRLIAFIEENGAKMSTQDMADELCISWSALKAHARRGKLKIRNVLQSKRVEMERRRQWLKKNGRGLTLDQIAKGLGVSKTTAYGFCQREGYVYENKIGRMVRKEPRAVSDLFVVGERENWLI